MPQSWWSRFFLWFLIPSVFLPSLLGSCQAHQLQLVSLSPSCSTTFSIPWQRSKYLSLFSLLSFSRCPPLEQQNPLDDKFSFFLLINSRFSLLANIWWSVCISKTRRILCILFSRYGSCLCIYHLVARLEFNLFHNTQLITLPTQSFVD